MPECQECDRYFAPNAVLDDGSCPKCGTQVETPTEARPRPKVPWHFWVVLTLAAGYLLWRLVESLIWGSQQIF